MGKERKCSLPCYCFLCVTGWEPCWVCMCTHSCLLLVQVKRGFSVMFISVIVLLSCSEVIFPLIGPFTYAVISHSWTFRAPILLHRRNRNGVFFFHGTWYSMVEEQGIVAFQLELNIDCRFRDMCWEYVQTPPACRSIRLLEKAESIRKCWLIPPLMLISVINEVEANVLECWEAYLSSVDHTLWDARGVDVGVGKIDHYCWELKFSGGWIGERISLLRLNEQGKISVLHFIWLKVLD